MSASNTSAPIELLKQLDQLQEREARYRLKAVQDFLVRHTQMVAYRTRGEELLAEARRQGAIIDALQARMVERTQLEQELLRDLEHFTHARARAEDERDALSGRLHELRNSLSWRVTAPLRALQRKFGRPLSSPAPNASVGTAEPVDVFTYFLHTSPFRIYREREATLRGWMFPRDGRAITAVRVTIDGKVFIGRYGLSEPEVVREHGPLPNNPAPGFEVTFTLSPGRHHMAVHAELEHAHWRTVVQTPIWCDRAAPAQ